MKALMPTRSLALLLAIGFLDLFTTLWLHVNGMMVELNPIMRYFLLKDEWVFVLVKSATLFGAWGVLVWYAKQNREFVRRSCLWASGAYVALWVVWFSVGHFVLN